MARKLTEREKALLQRLYGQCGGTEFITADAAMPGFGRRDPDDPLYGLSVPGAGRILARLAREGYCEHVPGAFGRYRRREPVE